MQVLTTTKEVFVKTNRQRLTLKEKKVQSKAKRMSSAKGNSTYARKIQFLKAHGGSACDYPDKPWK